MKNKSYLNLVSFQSRMKLLLFSAMLIVGSKFSFSQSSINLMDHLNSAPPVGCIFEWHNGSPVNNSNLMAANQYNSVLNGVFYAVYHDTLNDCYGTGNEFVVIRLNCYGSTGNLSSYVTSSPPGSTVKWYNNNTHSGSPVSNTASVPAGFYFAFYHNTATNSYVFANCSALIYSPNSQLLFNSVNSSNVLCNADENGSISLIATGGITPYTYSFDNGTTYSSQAWDSTLMAGIYTVVVKDGNNCTKDTTITITEPAVFEMTNFASINASCFGVCDGELTATMQGGTTPYTYVWSANAATGNMNQATNLCAGSYNLTITDDNGCVVDTLAHEIAQPGEIIITQLNVDSVVCNGNNDGMLTLAATNGDNYSIAGQLSATNTTGLFNNLEPGNYTITIADVNGCELDSSFAVFEPSELIINTVTSSNVLCNGEASGTIAVAASGGIAPIVYSFDNGSTFSSQAWDSTLLAGMYTVIVNDGNDCTKDTSITITEPAVFEMTTFASTNASCFGVCDGELTATMQGGTTPYTYVWSANAATGNINIASNLCAGSYNLTITDDNGCVVDTLAHEITQPGEIIITQLDVDSVVCNGANDGILTLVATNGDNYSIAGQMTATNTTGVFNSLEPGNYTITIADVNGCEIDSSFAVFEPAELFAFANNDSTICPGSVFNLSAHATGGTTPYSYDWVGVGNIANLPVTVNTNSLYTIVVSDSKGCFDSENVQVNVSPMLNVANVSGGTICLENSFLANVVVNNGLPNYTYQWSPSPISGQGTANALLAVGNYTVKVKDACNNEQTKTVVVQAHSMPGLTVFGFVNGCVPHDVSVSVASVGITNCSWDFGDQSSASGCGTINHVYTQAGTYFPTFHFASADGCLFDTTFISSITASDLPNAEFKYSPETPTVIDRNVQFTNLSFGGDVFQWTFAQLGMSTDENPSFAFPFNEAGTYEVCLTTTDSYGSYSCSNQYCEELTVEEEFLIHVPNCFTPDGSEHNEVFKAVSSMKNLDYFEFKVINRWGELVFRSNDIKIGWDGTFNGVLVPNGQYIWTLRTKLTSDSDMKSLKGSVLLNR